MSSDGEQGGRERALEALLTDVQRKAITGSVYVGGEWVLTTQYENHPEIQEDLSEEIADCVSGILTPLGCEIRAALAKHPTSPEDAA